MRELIKIIGFHHLEGGICSVAYEHCLEPTVVKHLGGELEAVTVWSAGSIRADIVEFCF